MSLSALTTAMAVAAATVPNGDPPASAAPFDFESAAMGQDPLEVAPEAGSEVSLPFLLVQSTAPPQLTEPAQSSETAKSTGPVQSADPGPSTPAESQAPAPTSAPKEIIV